MRYDNEAVYAALLIVAQCTHLGEPNPVGTNGATEIDGRFLPLHGKSPITFEYIATCAYQNRYVIAVDK